MVQGLDARAIKHGENYWEKGSRVLKTSRMPNRATMAYLRSGGNVRVIMIVCSTTYKAAMHIRISENVLQDVALFAIRSPVLDVALL